MKRDYTEILIIDAIKATHIALREMRQQLNQLIGDVNLTRHKLTTLRESVTLDTFLGDYKIRWLRDKLSSQKQRANELRFSIKYMKEHIIAMNSKLDRYRKNIKNK